MSEICKNWTEWLKKNRLWGETRDYYIEKKNNLKQKNEKKY